jgi:hypothetical protein
VRDPQLPEPLVRAVDAEGRLPAALEVLGPVTGRDVAVVDEPEGPGARRLLALGAWVRTTSASGLGRLPDASADVLVAWRTRFVPVGDEWRHDLAQAQRVLRRGGRLLVVKDYGRDEVTPLFGDEVRARALVGYSHPKGPFLGVGFRVRVLHCWWQWATPEDAAAELGAWFGEVGRSVAQAMRRPRLSYKVAVYHADASQLAGMAA